MPAQLNLADELAAVQNTSASATGWADAVESLFAHLAGTANRFGTAATRDVGTAEGEVPVLDSDGRLADGRLPLSRVMQQLRLLEYAPDLATDSDRVQTVRYLWQTLRRAARPRSTLLFGSLDATSSGTQIQTAGLAIDLSQTWRDFREIELLVSRGGIRLPSVRVTPDALFNAVEVDAGLGSTLSIQHAANDPGTFTRVQFTRTGATPYRIIAVEGVNPDTGLAAEDWVSEQLSAAVARAATQRLARAALDIGVEGAAPAAVTLTRAQFEAHYSILLNPGAVAPVAAVGRAFNLTLPNGAAGPFAVLNATAVPCDVRSHGAPAPAVRVVSGEGRVGLLVDGNAIYRAVPLATTNVAGLVRIAPAYAGEAPDKAASIGSVADAITGVARIHSPAFTGTPTAPTPPRPSS